VSYALLLALSGQPGPGAVPPWYGAPWAGGRVYTGSLWHVGIRPAVYVDRVEVAVGVTAQVTGRI